MIVLDRMAIEEAGPRPRDFAEAIHDQLKLTGGQTPIREIAFALDIVEIRACELVGIEGALLMTEDRCEGAIVINAKGSVGRRNFTIAHELLHFLNVRHQPNESGRGFLCTEADFRARNAFNPGNPTLHHRQEAEANLFAVEVLAPRHLMRQLFTGPPNLEQALALVKIGLSREAAAWRIVELSDTPAAVVFSKDRVVRYSRKNKAFPRLVTVSGTQVPNLPLAASSIGLSCRVTADPRVWVWVRGERHRPLFLQTLWQQGGYAITMLSMEASGD